MQPEHSGWCKRHGPDRMSRRQVECSAICGVRQMNTCVAGSKGRSHRGGIEDVEYLVAPPFLFVHCPVN